MSKPLPILGQSAVRGDPAAAPVVPKRPRASGASGRRYQVDGLCCAAEARQIEARLGARDDVSSLVIDPVGHTLTVQGAIGVSDVERAIAELGMTARPVDEPGRAHSWWTRRGRLLLATLSGALWLASLAPITLLDAVGARPVLALGAVLAGGWHVFPRAWISVRNRALDMNFLMSAAALGALLIGEHAEAASVMFLFAVAQLLERGSMERARSAIRSLMELTPAQATVLRDGAELRVPAEDVEVGETVVVRPGEKIPVDGTIVAGRSAVNQAALTGESIPVAREPGDEVFAGTLNGDGVLEARSTRAHADTTLSRIIHSVEEAQATRAPSQAFVDRFARVYTPVVVGAAVLLAVAPPLLVGAAWGEWIYRALALLVVACPCALVISTPVTVVSALAGAARHGILIKGGLHLETAGRARAVALDKTGTVTEGRPVVVSVVPVGRAAEPGRLLALAAAVEARSEHPLAAAIVERARDEALRLPEARETRARPGLGAEARVDGARVLVGSERLLELEGLTDPAAVATARGLEQEGRTVVLVARAGVVLGVIALADRVRAEAGPAVEALRAAGIREVTILTGDNPVTARSVADAVGGGLAEVRAGLLPQDKVTAIQEMRSRHGPVLMVGDGVNDAPALASADVGVAMGAAGTDVALETADIALMADDLSKLPVLIRLARKAEGIIRANIAFALAVKAVFVVLAVAGLATLWMAVLADMGASLLVIGNGMRALRPPIES